MYACVYQFVCELNVGDYTKLHSPLSLKALVWDITLCILCSGACAHLSGYEEHHQQSNVDVCTHVYVRWGVGVILNNSIHTHAFVLVPNITFQV